MKIKDIEIGRMYEGEDGLLVVTGLSSKRVSCNRYVSFEEVHYKVTVSRTRLIEDFITHYKRVPHIRALLYTLSEKWFVDALITEKEL